MNILMFGSKEYPLGASTGYDPKAGGGIEMHVEKLSKYISKEGHVVFIITRKFPQQGDEEHFGTMHVYRVPFIYNKYLRTFTFNLLSLIKAVSLSRKHRIDLIHSHGIVGSFFASIFSIITKTPLVITPHGTVDEWGIFKIPLKVFESLSLRIAKKVIFISPESQKKMTLHRKLNHALLSNGIDFDDITQPKERTWKRVRFGFIGRLEKIKGLPLIIDAFKSLPHRSCELLIAGEGPLKEKLLNDIKPYKNIRFLGWSEPNKFFDSIDVFVLPSKEKGQPIALLEAMAHGKIILTTLNFIENRKTGILIRYDKQELFEKMLDIANNLNKYLYLSKNARKKAAELSWSRQVHRFLNEYKKIISQSSNKTISI